MAAVPSDDRDWSTASSNYRRAGTCQYGGALPLDTSATSDVRCGGDIKVVVGITAQRRHNKTSLRRRRVTDRQPTTAPRALALTTPLGIYSSLDATQNSRLAIWSRPTALAHAVRLCAALGIRRQSLWRIDV